MISFDIKNISILLLEYAVKTSIAFSSTLLIINYLSPGEYGLISLSLTIFGLFSAFHLCGLDSILLANLLSKKKSKEDKNKDVKASIYIRCAMASMIFLIILILYSITDNKIIFLVLMLSFGLFIDSFNVAREISHAAKNYKTLLFSAIFSGIMQVVSTVILILMDFSVEWFVIPYVINKAFFTIFLIILNRANFDKRVVIEKSYCFRLASQGLPMIIVAVGGLAYAALDQWMIGYYLSAHDVGIYAAGIKLVISVIVLPTIIANVLYHKIISLHQSPEFNNFIVRLYSFFFYSGVFLCLLLFLSSEWLVQLLYPEDYQDSRYIMELYCFVLLFAFFQAINNKILILDGYRTLIMYRVLLALLVNGILNLYFIPSFGIIGAVYSTIISEFFVFISYFFNKRTRFIFFYQIRGLSPVHLIYLKKSKFKF